MSKFTNGYSNSRPTTCQFDDKVVRNVVQIGELIRSNQNSGQKVGGINFGGNDFMDHG